MLRLLRIATIALTLAASAAVPAASADSVAVDPDLSVFHENTLTCGGMTYDVLQNPAYIPYFYVVGGTSVFIPWQILYNGTVISTTAAVSNGSNFLGGRELVECTFRGLISGRLFTVLGVFTPVGH